MRKLITLLFTCALVACNSSLPPLPTVAPFPTSIPEPPLFIPTLAPTRTREPLPTITPPLPPSATPSPSCDLNLMLNKLKKLIAYKEFNLTYNALLNTRTLNVWFVEPKLDPKGAVTQNINVASLSAATVSDVLGKGDANCLTALVGVLTFIVVDRNYEAWYSGSIKLSDALAKVPLESKVSLLTATYARTTAPTLRAAAPAQTCSWLEARAKLQKLFPSGRENAGFEFVLDDAGSTVYAQWDGLTDATVTAILLSVAAEVRCVYPPVDQLVIIVVDTAGQINLAAQVPGTAIRSPNAASEVPNQVKVLYPQR